MININSKEEAIDIILKQEPLIIYGKQSEWGPRALGQRSILFEKREWWRPLAGTILLEHVHNYFDIGSLKETPYMSFAVYAKKKAIKEIPSIVHVDNTCRVQTIDKGPYYDLIKCFYDKTNVPLLLNTSFNLAGFPIVETEEFLKFTIQNSEFKYVYKTN